MMIIVRSASMVSLFLHCSAQKSGNLMIARRWWILQSWRESFKSIDETRFQLSSVKCDVVTTRQRQREEVH